MSESKLLIFYFTVAGLVGGFGATYPLWPALGSEQSNVVLGPKHGAMALSFSKAWLLLVYPIAGAALSAFWARFFRGPGFGLPRGALVTFMAFLSFCALLSLVGANFFLFFPISFFGFIFGGWVLVLVGAVTGWLYRRQIIAKHTYVPQSGAPVS
jgi:hypothetical protein